MEDAKGQAPVPSVQRRSFTTREVEKIGRRGWTRTSDPQLRRLMLYPPELRARTDQCITAGWEPPP
jgi:hypothetical protein